MDTYEILREDSPSPKKTYATPRLTEYGSIAKLTQSGGSANGDAGLLMPCL